MQRWYITFHGGEHPHAWNNIHAFDLDGKPIGKVLGTTGMSDEIELRELRGFVFGNDGDLYVTNAWQGGSHILRFHGALNERGQHDFREVFVEQHAANPGLSHPFDVNFGSEGHLFVPSQDTNVVSRYFGPTATTSPGAPMPIPLAIKELARPDIPPGTFVPSRHHADHGLASVRGTTFGPDDNLYVVDRDENAVKAYDGNTGHHIRTYHHHRLDRPIHIRPGLDDRNLLVGSRDAHAVFSLDVDSGDLSQVVAPEAGGLHSPAGFDVGQDGALYVASRDTQKILRFDATTGKPDRHPVISDLDDLPEFLRLVDVT